MKINVTLDLAQFHDEWQSYAETLTQALKDELKKQALKELKASPEFRALVSQLQDDLLKRVSS